MAQRVKGQEVSVVVTSRTKGTEESIGSVSSASIEFKQDILTEGFLGETTDRHDDIFRGTTGKMEIQIESGQVFDFVERVNARARRRGAAQDEVFTVIFTITTPDGESPRIQLSDVKFESIPLTFGGRDEYVKLSLSFASDDYEVIRG